MSDYRNELLQTIRESLATILKNETNDVVIRKITCILNDYEVTKKCTDVVVYDDQNERILKRYCACLMVDGKSEKTIKEYQRLIKKFLDTTGKPVKEIGVYDIRFFLAAEKERGVSNRTVENCRAYLSAFFQWLSAEEILPRNPCANVKPIKYTEKERLPFTSVELDALRQACVKMKERALIEALLTSGVRVSELALMDVSDIDFQTLAVHVRHGKGDKERTTYINDVAKHHLQKYVMARADISPSLFCNRNGQRLTTGGIRSILKAIAKRANVDNVHPHRFRRTFATGLAARGMAIQDIQKLLGHSDLNTTMEYVCISNTKVKASYNQYIA